MSDGGDPWRCPSCLTWLAPHVTEHRCDPPEAAVPVTSTGPPGSGGTFAAAGLPNTITVNLSGPVDDRDLALRVQENLVRMASTNAARSRYGLPGRAA